MKAAEHESQTAPCSRRRARRRWLLLLLIPICFVFWFVTAPANLAVQRITSGGGFVSRFISRAADSYEAPMAWFCQFPEAKRFNDSMTDWWCDVLDAPETTP